ncbi:hypothetical protein HAX54_041780 [Datura stramonium]|uniref:Uncharacterized protein n=1 Tax=Datura stramonium TaxID=4076 RepID=A0ABS8SLA9_DATST|nr:hypothetical protein [Datura stramonium]
MNVMKLCLTEFEGEIHWATFTSELPVRPSETPVEMQVRVQGFWPLSRPVFHRHFARQDQRDASVDPDVCCLPSLMYSIEGSSASRGYPHAFRRRSTWKDSDMETEESDEEDSKMGDAAYSPTKDEMD